MTTNDHFRLQTVRTAKCRGCQLPIIQYGESRWWHGELTNDHSVILAGERSPLRSTLIGYIGNLSVTSDDRTEAQVRPFITAWRELLDGDETDVIRFNPGDVPSSHLNLSCRGGLAAADQWEKRESLSKSSVARPEDVGIREFHP